MFRGRLTACVALITCAGTLCMGGAYADTQADASHTDVPHADASRTEAPPADASPAGSPHHTFWVVPGRHNTVYLLGSIHVLKPEDSALPPEALSAYGSARSLVMELDLNSLGTDKVLAATLAQAALPQGHTLADALGPEVYARFKSQAEPLGLDPAFLSRFQPWFAALTLEQVELVHAGFAPDSGVDLQLARRAQSDHKPIIGLETIDDQLGLFARLDATQQRQFVLYTLEDTADLQRELDAVVRAWKSGDTQQLAALLGEGFEKFPVLYRALTTDRNRRWLGRIAQLLNDDQDYLVVVGALHLVGRDGLVELLQRRGYHPVQH